MVGRLFNDEQADYFTDYSMSPTGMKIISQIIELAGDFSVDWQQTPEMDDEFRSFFIDKKEAGQVMIAFMKLEGTKLDMEKRTGFWLLGITHSNFPAVIPKEILDKIFTSLSEDELSEIKIIIDNIPKK